MLHLGLRTAAGVFALHDSIFLFKSLNDLFNYRKRPCVTSSILYYFVTNKGSIKPKVSKNSEIRQTIISSLKRQNCPIFTFAEQKLRFLKRDDPPNKSESPSLMNRNFGHREQTINTQIKGFVNASNTTSYRQMETVLINQSRTSLLNVDGQIVAHVCDTYLFLCSGRKC